MRTSLSCLLLVLMAVFVLACPQSSGPESAPTEDERTSPQTEPPAQKESRDDGMMGDGMMGDGMMGDGPPEWMMSRDGMGPRMMADMRPIRQLLRQHTMIDRRVENIPGGVVTHTRSEDPDVAESIRTHVHQMKRRLEKGQPIRMMDPLFREIFRHHEAIEMRIEEIPGGVTVTETSADPEVVALIRQHAHRAVSEFVEYGMSRAMEPTPLPQGYPAR